MLLMATIGRLGVSTLTTEAVNSRALPLKLGIAVQYDPFKLSSNPVQFEESISLILGLAVCPSGQWEGTANPPALPSKV